MESVAVSPQRGRASAGPEGEKKAGYTFWEFLKALEVGDEQKREVADRLQSLMCCPCSRCYHTRIGTGRRACLVRAEAGYNFVLADHLNGESVVSPEDLQMVLRALLVVRSPKGESSAAHDPPLSAEPRRKKEKKEKPVRVPKNLRRHIP